jgi:hypothetical protein
MLLALQERVNLFRDGLIKEEKISKSIQQPKFRKQVFKTADTKLIKGC